MSIYLHSIVLGNMLDIKIMRRVHLDLGFCRLGEVVAWQGVAGSLAPVHKEESDWVQGFGTRRSIGLVYYTVKCLHISKIYQLCEIVHYANRLEMC